MNLQRIDLFEMAIAYSTDLFYLGYDGESLVHDIMDASFFGREEGGNVEFARKALRLIVDMGYEGLLDRADDDGFTPLYLNRHNPKAVALFKEFGITEISRLPPMPWKADD